MPRHLPIFRAPVRRPGPAGGGGDPDPPAPAAPTNLVATAVSSSRIDLAWAINAPEAAHRIEWSPDGTSSWAERDTVAPGVDTYSDTGRIAETTYHYRVIAVGTGGAPDSAPSAVASATTLEAAGGGERALLAVGDLAYLGAFRLPDLPGGDDPQYSAGGLTLRREGGTPTLLATGYHDWGVGGAVYEMAIPTPADPSPPDVLSSYPRATLVRYWGDVYGEKRWNSTGSPTGPANKVHGVFWDGVASRLYWNYAIIYAGDNADPCVGYSTLDDGDGSSTPAGSWRPEGVNADRAKGGTLRIPAWFASAHCPGKPLGVGAGSGYNTNAAASMGPALAAMAEPSPAEHGDDPSERPTVPATVLLAYGHDNPARRDPDYEGAAYGEVAATGTSTTVVLPSPPFYDHPNNTDLYAGKAVTVDFADGTSQTRTSVSYGSGNVLTVDSPWSGGKVPGAGDWVKVATGLGASAFDKEPSGGVGYWTYLDSMRQSFAWVDDDAGTRARHGLLYLPHLATGPMSYSPGGYTYYTDKYQLWVYDPDDLAAVAAGSLQPDEVEPASRADLVFPPRAVYPAEHMQPDGRVLGAAFDPVDDRLYVLVSKVRSDGTSWNPMVMVYSVAGGS